MLSKGICLVLLASALAERDPDYKTHECKRVCNGMPKSCFYELTIDRFFTMQPDCGDCLVGKPEECKRKYCMVADTSKRPVTVYNGMLPGPTIDVCHGDRINVLLTNNLYSEVTTIHWHGLRQTGTQNMDGVPEVTQCAVPPMRSFNYSFIASQPGTHFYHSHVGVQRGDGAFGPLIIREVPEKLFVSPTEHLLTLVEWYDQPADTMAFNYYRNNLFYSRYTQSILINGIGANGFNRLEPERFVVEKDHLYRFRLANAANAGCAFEIEVEGHKMYAFNSDGHNFSPVEIDTLTLTNGERFDFVLHANQAVDEYAIKIEGQFGCAGKYATSILQYKGATEKPVAFNQSVSTTGDRLNCMDKMDKGRCIELQDLESENCFILEDKPDEAQFFAFDFYELKNGFPGVKGPLVATPKINKITYRPTKKVLLSNPKQEFCHENRTASGDCDEEGFCKCTHVVEVPNNKYIDIILIDEAQKVGAIHPFHLHGFSFAVLAQGRLGQSVTGDLVKQYYENGWISKRLISPVLKDSIGVHYGGYALVRIFTSNKGFWLLHCHIDFHSELGMQLVLKTKKVTSFSKDATCRLL